MTLGKSLKTEKKWKVGVGKSRVSSGDVRTLVSQKTGFGRSKKVRSEEIEGNDVPYAGGRNADKEGIRGKNNAKSEANQLDRNRGFKAVNSDGTRKRIYADHSNDEERVFRTPNRKFSSEVRPYKLHKENRKIQSFGRESKNKPSKSLDWKNSRAMVGDKDEEVRGFRSGNSNRSARSNSGDENQLEQNQTQRAADSAWKSFKKKVESTKSTTDDSRVVDERRKSKKRVKIRIDPHDLSNKRLDDGVSINNIVKQKKEDPETNNVELSKNAQFRAIRPSPSILSFVEDNFLGRRREIDFRRAGYNIELSAPLDNIPFSTSMERERIEETAFRNKLTFFAAAKVSSSFPPPDLPEIAFAGRSNVGKSSLLNSLTRQWGVARTSDKPGLTQTINFFNLGSKICLVDLPGYGFAYAKEEVKEAWEDLVKEYVSTRVGLKRVCLLVDTKWGMKPRDTELIDLMERSQTKYQIVLTKTDTVFPIDVARRAMQIEESLKEKKAAVQPVMMVSSQTGAGVRILRTALTKIARFIKP